MRGQKTAGDLMPSLYILMEQSLLTHRKTLRLARLLALDRCAVVERLVARWSWCFDNALDSVLAPDVDADMLADVMFFDASPGKPSDLLDALPGQAGANDDRADDDRDHAGERNAGV